MGNDGSKPGGPGSPEAKDIRQFERKPAGDAATPCHKAEIGVCC